MSLTVTAMAWVEIQVKCAKYADNNCLDRNQILMALLMICSEHCVYIHLRERMQLEKFFPLGFNRI